MNAWHGKRRLHRAWTAGVAALCVFALAGPVAAQGGPGPWNSPRGTVEQLDCDGDGTLETTLVVMLGQAAEGSAAYLRPGVGHVAGTTVKQVPMEVAVHLLVNGTEVAQLPPPPGIRQQGVGTGSWGHGAERTFSCSFIVEEFTDEAGNLIQIRVTVSGIITP